MHDKLAYARMYSRLKATGWTQEQFDEAWRAQQGRCAICQTFMEPRGRNPTSACADHDHVTGQRRGLLCKLCNTKLAPFENPGFARRALAYLAAPRVLAKASNSDRLLKGWVIRKPEGRNIWKVRFTHQGRTVERSTRERDEELARVAAERIYAQVQAGLLAA